jgi:hypothetical protein
MYVSREKTKFHFTEVTFTHTHKKHSTESQKTYFEEQERKKREKKVNIMLA